MIPGSKGHTFHASMKSTTLEPVKHEKVARIGRISNVFRIVGAQSAEQSVGIMGAKYLLTPTSYNVSDETIGLSGKYICNFTNIHSVIIIIRIPFFNICVI